jgi:hypothetical protein
MADLSVSIKISLLRKKSVHHDAQIFPLQIYVNSSDKSENQYRSY